MGLLRQPLFSHIGGADEHDNFDSIHALLDSKWVVPLPRSEIAAKKTMIRAIVKMAMLAILGVILLWIVPSPLDVLMAIAIMLGIVAVFLNYVGKVLEEKK